MSASVNICAGRKYMRHCMRRRIKACVEPSMDRSYFASGARIRSQLGLLSFAKETILKNKNMRLFPCMPEPYRFFGEEFDARCFNR